jgi:V/A-type H+-transporting ATPase subunit F
MSTSNIAIIGDEDSISCFYAVGVDVYPAERPDEVKAVFQKVSKQAYAIIFVTEQSARHIEAELQEIAWQPIPSVVLIPNHRGSLGLGQRVIRDVVKRAVGADIMKEEKGDT